MKKFLSIVILSLIIMSIPLTVKATSEMTQLKMKIINADEKYDLYMLLPKKYIKYAIQYDGLDIDYDGANTLKYNTIPSIIVDLTKIEEDTYIDNGTEYVQIKLDNLGEDEYLFEIIPQYTDMDMLYRIKSSSRDNIMIIENFTIKDNKCEMTYDYEANTLKVEKSKKISIKFNLKWWQIVLVTLLIIFLIYTYRRVK